MSLGVTQSGPKVEAVQYHNAPLPDHVPGEHLWVVISMYRVNPKAKGEYHLDTENLMTIDGPGCFHCEQHWSPEVAAKPCPGDPSRVNEHRSTLKEEHHHHKYKKRKKRRKGR